MTSRPSWDSELLGTVTGCLTDASRAVGDRVFLDFTAGGSYTYRDVEGLSNRFARGLASLAVSRGDTVATMLDNGIHAVTAWFGANKIGAVDVPVNTALRGQFLQHVLVDSQASVLIVEARYLTRLAAVVPPPQLRHVVVVPAAGQGAARGQLSLAELLDHSDDPLHDVNTPRDITRILYTSGTTGPSKGCMISHNYALHIADKELQVSGRRSTEASYTCLPLFHLNASVINVLSTARIQSTITVAPRFSLSGFWPDIRRSGATITSLLGSMVPLVAAAPDTEDSLACRGQLRFVAGQPWPGDTQQIFRHRFGVKVAGSQRYSLTEAFAVTSWLPADGIAPPGSSGHRNDDFDVRIFDDDDRELPAGAVGEIVVRPMRSHIMFEGYWKRPEASLEASRGLWFHTGDFGRFDDNGYLWFADRKKDYIRRGGENISSIEVEDAVRRHKEVADVAAVPLPSELSEDEVKISVVLREGSRLSEADLCRWCVDQMPHYAVPRYVELLPELPMTATGKVQKFALREAGVTPNTWDRASSDVVVRRD